MRKNFVESKVLSRLAEQDGLTGLYNRRSFDQHLDRLWRQSRREESQLTLMLVDIDHFKAFNDHYGHQAGDDALKRVAEVIGDRPRSARWTSRPDTGVRSLRCCCTARPVTTDASSRSSCARTVLALKILHTSFADGAIHAGEHWCGNHDARRGTEYGWRDSAGRRGALSGQGRRPQSRGRQGVTQRPDPDRPLPRNASRPADRPLPVPAVRHAGPGFGRRQGFA